MSTKSNRILENRRFSEKSRMHDLFLKRNSWFAANLTKRAEISYIPPAPTGLAFPISTSPTRVVRLLTTDESTWTPCSHPKFKFIPAFILGLPSRGCGRIQDDIYSPLQCHDNQFHGPPHSLCSGYHPFLPYTPQSVIFVWSPSFRLF